MPVDDQQLDPGARAQEKQASRLADERDLRLGHKSAEDLQSENEHFALFAQSAQPDLSASRSLG
jgi:hypothetical protein